jgi:uncharacterized protein YbjT (DUF2867 family)
LARALIVGCGCRGRELGRALIERGWQVRGTSRAEASAPAIAQAGIEAAVADPGRVGSVLELIDDVAVIFWLLGSAVGPPEDTAALHGPRLERLLEEIVDTPVRGFVYEGGGELAAEVRARGASVVRAAEARWRIPSEVIEADAERPGAWCAEMLAGVERLLSR